MGINSKRVIFLSKEELLNSYYEAVEDTKEQYGQVGLTSERLRDQFDVHIKSLLKLKSDGKRIHNVTFDSDLPALKRNLYESPTLSDMREYSAYEIWLLDVIWDETIRFLAGNR